MTSGPAPKTAEQFSPLRWNRLMLTPPPADRGQVVSLPLAHPLVILSMPGTVATNMNWRARPARPRSARPGHDAPERGKAYDNPSAEQVGAGDRRRRTVVATGAQPRADPRRAG